jgi:protein SERAC1
MRHSIIAVHGLNGSSIKTWTSDTRERICWLNHPDFLPKYIQHARVLTWGYNAKTVSLAGKPTSGDRILQHAQSLVQQLCADREVRVNLPRPK